MTRILLLSPFTLPFPCGNSTMAERLREGLASRGHEVALFDSSHRRPGEAVAFAPRILHSLNADRPYLWVREFMTDHSLPWVITLTGTDYNSWRGQKEPPVHIGESLRKADALVVFHEEARLALLPFLPEAEQKIQVIPQGVTYSIGPRNCRFTREKYGLPSGQIIFLMVSGIRRIKNIEHAVRAFCEALGQIRALTLVLIGPVIEQAETDRVLAMAESLENFYYLGEKSPSEVRELMGCVDVFLNTSLQEGMPGAVLEAMAEGLPILASDIPGNRALVKHGENGLLFPLVQTSELVGLIVRLSKDRGLRQEMGRAGQKFISARHSIDQELDRYEAVYRRILEPRRGP